MGAAGAAASIAVSTSSSAEVQSARGSSCPDCTRERSSRLSTRWVSRSLSPATTATSSPRASSPSVGDCRPAAAAVIAVSGERRSWETERSSAVLTTLLRRSARVSITCASRPSRRRAAVSSVSRLGITRVSIPSMTGSAVARGTATVPARTPSTTTGSARRRESLEVQLGSTSTQGSSNALAIRWPTIRSDSSRSVPLSRTRAISALRSASRLRRSASSARARAEEASCDVTTAAMRNTPRATQFCSSPIVSRPVGGMWKKLNASALATAVPIPSLKPQKVDASSTGSR